MPHLTHTHSDSSDRHTTAPSALSEQDQQYKKPSGDQQAKECGEKEASVDTEAKALQPQTNPSNAQSSIGKEVAQEATPNKQLQGKRSSASTQALEPLPQQAL